MVMSREDFIGLLTPAQVKFIWDCIQGGLGDYSDPTYYGPAARRDHTASVRAHIRNSHIVARAQRMVIEHPELGIRCVAKGQRILFYIAEQARLSFKLLDESLRSRNYPTDQARAFLQQLWPNDNADAGLDEIQVGDISVAQPKLWPSGILGYATPATNVIAGYVPNATESAFQIWITCPDGTGLHWEWQLNAADIIELLTATKVAETAAVRKVRRRGRVQVKPEVARNQGTDESVG